MTIFSVYCSSSINIVDITGFFTRNREIFYKKSNWVANLIMVLWWKVIVSRCQRVESYKIPPTFMPGIILCMVLANERRRYIVMSPVIVWAHIHRMIPGADLTSKLRSHPSKTNTLSLSKLKITKPMNIIDLKQIRCSRVRFSITCTTIGSINSTWDYNTDTYG